MVHYARWWQAKCVREKGLDNNIMDSLYCDRLKMFAHNWSELWGHMAQLDTIYLKAIDCSSWYLELVQHFSFIAFVALMGCGRLFRSKKSLLLVGIWLQNAVYFQVCFCFFFFFLFLEQYDMNIRRVVEIGMVCQKETILMQILTTVSNDHCGILLLLMLSAAFSEFMLQFLG